MKKLKNKFKIFDQSPRSFLLEGPSSSIDLAEDFLFLTTQKIRVLVVVDTSVRFTESGGFGVGRFIKLLRETKVGCTEFIVDIAVRPTVSPNLPLPPMQINANPGTNAAHYVNFRFDGTDDGSLILSKYHEMFLFGFAPDNNAMSDSNITNHPWHTTVSELQVIQDWMNSGGGVFATGDHDYLGASMCHRVPRVGTMRKWTNDDGVPPINGPTRLDTNRPSNSAQAEGTQTILNSNQRDNIPQIIDWVVHRTTQTGRFRQKYPHPILCHPTEGIINVMPDHAHEGCCVEPRDIDFNAEVKFGGSKEYPSFGGVQPKPKIIAYGNVIQGTNYEKGRVNGVRFPMISVYDGRENNSSNTGRVVVDSTWHHWFNLNIEGFEADSDKENWNKISRYFVNVAIWIAPKNVFRQHFWWEVARQHFVYSGIREINRNTPLIEVGDAIKQSLSLTLGRCYTLEYIFENICVVRPELCNIFERFQFDFDPLDPVCLSCPPFETLESLIYGSIYRKLEPITNKIKERLVDYKTKDRFVVEAKELQEIAIKATHEAIDIFSENLLSGFKKWKKVLK
ncbi:MAG: hypothetical protein MK226_06440 [Saprospiraceae bacterium]|nr:hypothetical protein [Saprospiraceae bacterium]